MAGGQRRRSRFDPGRLQHGKHGADKPPGLMGASARAQEAKLEVAVLGASFGL